ncbi:MAG: polyprenyl synthetase family protein [Candidatus Thiodiazotropha lotti]|uniref:Octaprenyl diphosphate synthase n=1 Tax=Candidatus Thiodiazotropha endoloripes TaxID=1818881 RepID=A0A1E2ULA0_9GAMM|nr:polyprenyl synthetase family protein [Candidatus Thiodiazotropha endoloripes]MCG7899351.1 polyprenyl synthetase family protein [Candidatus Thiodiazotropha weberae]MCG7992039.1 polyprenyl synthetase family protein [Candidatus Thiodiazotropha lotti]MCG7904427.1 polyprenyl synthetase family protein [Candidatus Thiodiazotropha weberae]MCG7998543.1 polyprenyl synthetase family protein [Candidatus Thiodiazotropha lotti]MCW4183697.1 polyprenyl synthetase family protein [Candidatus Thiodiazotropha 
MDIKALRQLIADDMDAVDKLIIQQLKSDVVLINQIGAYIVHSGGKRLRPMIVLLAARACGYAGSKHINLAAIIEFIHTATLLHDDVVDGSDLRRNRETANAVWGNEASVLVGDFLYSRSFEMMVEVGQMPVMDILSHATNRIAEGEVLQLLNVHNPETSEAEYMEVIKRKTATLFEAGSRLGGVVAEISVQQQQALADYGLHLGIAFQLVDDALDYHSSNEEIGKNVGDDLAEGKPTLPLIQAMKKSDQQQRQRLATIIENGGLEEIDFVLQAIHNSDAISYTQQLAQQHAELAKQALNHLPDSDYRLALADLADYSVARTH